MTTRLLLAAAVLSLFAVACGNDESDVGPTQELPAVPGDEDPPVVAGACLEEEPDCPDTLKPLPDEDPVALDPATGEPLGDGSLLVSDVVGVDIDGGFAISGFVWDDGTGLRLCDGLLESFPPQCGEPSLRLENPAVADLGPLQSEQGVTWSDQPVRLLGELVDDAFVVAADQG